jgi:quinol monooxygenase YgiN
MAYVLAAKWTANEGEGDRVADALQRLAVHSREEPGCRFYQPCRDPESPDTFLIFEIYDDADAFAAHGASDHFQAIAVGEAFDLLADRERTFYETL